ncbi:AAA-12 domain-containing protein [Aphelenchoides fujianensis]|nr:AAA-12 domain-containing protein [Aphelenchoides fujianensis]
MFTLPRTPVNEMGWQNRPPPRNQQSPSQQPLSRASPQYPTRASPQPPRASPQMSRSSSQMSRASPQMPRASPQPSRDSNGFFVPQHRPFRPPAQRPTAGFPLQRSRSTSSDSLNRDAGNSRGFRFKQPRLSWGDESVASGNFEQERDDQPSFHKRAFERAAWTFADEWPCTSQFSHPQAGGEKREILKAIRSNKTDLVHAQVRGAINTWERNENGDARPHDRQTAAIVAAAKQGARWFVAQTFHGWGVAVVCDPAHWFDRIPDLPNPVAFCFEEGREDAKRENGAEEWPIELTVFIRITAVTRLQAAATMNGWPRTVCTPLAALNESLVFTHAATRWTLDATLDPLRPISREPALYTDARVWAGRSSSDRITSAHEHDQCMPQRRALKLGRGESKTVTVAAAFIWGPAEISSAFVDKKIDKFDEDQWYEVEVFRPHQNDIPIVFDNRVVGVLPPEYVHQWNARMRADYADTPQEQRDRQIGAELVRMEPFGFSSNQSNTGGLFPVRLFALSEEAAFQIAICAQPEKNWTLDDMRVMDSRLLRLSRIVALRAISYNRASGKHRFEDLAVEVAEVDPEKVSLRMTAYDFYSSWNTLKDGCRVLLHTTNYPRHIDLFVVATALNGTLTLQLDRKELSPRHRRFIQQLMPFGRLTHPDEWETRTFDWVYNFERLPINLDDPALCISCAESGDLDGQPFASSTDETITLLYAPHAPKFWQLEPKQTRLFRIAASMPLDARHEREEEEPEEIEGQNGANGLLRPIKQEPVDELDVNGNMALVPRPPPQQINPFAVSPNGHLNGRRQHHEHTPLFKTVMRYTDDVIVQTGGAGSGKTRSLARLTRELQQSRAGSSELFVVLLTAQTNDAVDQLAVELIKARVPPSAILHCTSQKARDHRYTNLDGGDMPVDHRDAIARLSHVVLDLNRTATSELQSIRRVTVVQRVDFSTAARFNDNVHEAFAEMPANFRVLLGTTSVVRRVLPNLDAPVDLMAIDEAGQVTTSDAIALLDSARSPIRRLLVTGDLHYIETFIPVRAASLADYGLQSFLRTCYNHPASQLIEKFASFRFHSQLFAALNAAIYGGQMELAGEVNDEYLNAFDGLPGRCPNAPLILVDNRSKEQKDENETSTYNPTQAIRVVNVVELLIQRLPALRDGALTCAVLTFYSRMQKEIADLLTPLLLTDHPRIFDQFEVSTVDTFAGRQVDIVVLAMVRQQPSAFTFNTHRLTTALTRARHGMFIVGQMGPRVDWHRQRLGHDVEIPAAPADLSDGLELMRAFLNAAGDEALLEDKTWKIGVRDAERHDPEQPHVEEQPSVVEQPLDEEDEQDVSQMSEP